MAHQVNVGMDNILCHKPEKGRDKYIIYYGVRIFLSYKNPITGKWNLSLRAPTFLLTYDLVKEGVDSLEEIFEAIEKEFNNGLTTGVWDCRRNSNTGNAKKT